MTALPCPSAEAMARDPNTEAPRGSKRRPYERHGYRRNDSAEYRIWTSMIQRCENPNRPKYPRYGGRGIRVCDLWRQSFAAFLKDVGHRPSRNHTLDRIDNDGNYEPGNVRWATAMMQAHNCGRTRKLVVHGVCLSRAEWARVSGLSYWTLRTRDDRGLPPEQVVGPKGVAHALSVLHSEATTVVPVRDPRDSNVCLVCNKWCGRECERPFEWSPNFVVYARVTAGSDCAYALQRDQANIVGGVTPFVVWLREQVNLWRQMRYREHRESFDTPLARKAFEAWLKEKY